ncbi:MAG TPA: 4'-phosphopantetheinyl transferase superfamily protein [Puia sp.]|nr:4'-phosphopantetheinyl transferase superfamily protein [Puia sp.]
MSIRIYSTAYPTPVSREIWQSLLPQLPGSMIQKIEKYRRWQDAHGCLFGKHLLLAALRNEGFAGGLTDLRYTAHERPYLVNGPDFNISHSGTRVVCILGSRGGVGIDLEEIRELAIADFKDQFSDREWGMILDSPKPLHTFYHFWTAKECLSKADGRGLNLPLAGLKIEDNMFVQLGERSWNIRALPWFGGYACHIASEELAEKPSLMEFTPAEILTLSLRDQSNFH